MTKESVAPVVVGLAVGICFVIVMSAGVDSMKPAAVYYGNRTPIPIPERQNDSIILEEEAIMIALNARGLGAEYRDSAKISLTQYYIDEVGNVYERNVQTGELIRAEDDGGLSLLDRQGKIDKPMHCWDVTLEFSAIDVSWILINASDGEIVRHFVT